MQPASPHGPRASSEGQPAVQTNSYMRLGGWRVPVILSEVLAVGGFPHPKSRHYGHALAADAKVDTKGYTQCGRRFLRFTIRGTAKGRRPILCRSTPIGVTQPGPLGRTTVRKRPRPRLHLRRRVTKRVLLHVEDRSASLRESSCAFSNPPKSAQHRRSAASPHEAQGSSAATP